jgi:hypothetical protein
MVGGAGPLGRSLRAPRAARRAEPGGLSDLQF